MSCPHKITSNMSKSHRTKLYKRQSRKRRKRKVYMNKPKSRRSKNRFVSSANTLSLSREPNLIQTQIINKETGEKLIVFSHGDIIDVDPIKHYKNSHIVKNMIISGVPNEELIGKDDVSDFGKKKFIEANEMWYEFYNKIIKTEIPHNLLDLLLAKKKNEQKCLLKRVPLTADIILAFILKAYKDYGFLFSEYRSETFPKSIDSTQMPFAYSFENGKVNKYGETSLSDGKLKQAIKQRKVIVAKFLDDGTNWHCFIVTYKSLRGEETWKNGQPHYHYVSNKFNLTKEEVIQQIKSGEYPDTSVHIELLDYGAQPNESL